jgi:hypothetical protein
LNEEISDPKRYFAIELRLAHELMFVFLRHASYISNIHTQHRNNAAQKIGFATCPGRGKPRS